MRYDTKVHFYKEGAEVYDPETGSMTGAETDLGWKWCHKHDIPAQKTVQIYGRADAHAIEIHHRGKVLDADIVRIGDQHFHISQKLDLRFKAVYTAEEVGR